MKDPNVLFVVGAVNKELPFLPHMATLGFGPFVSILTEHAGREPLVFSKPHKDLAAQIVKENGSNCLFIGDT